mgnify:CR=1 FL=1
MKCAIVTPRFTQPSQKQIGAVDYSHHRAKQLKEAGHDVTVHTPLFIGEQAVGNWEGIPIKYYPFKVSIGEFAKGWLPNLNGYVLVHYCGGFRNVHTLSYLFKGKAKVLFSPFYPDKPRTNLMHKLMIPVIDTFWSFPMLFRCDAVCAETRIEMNWLEQHGVNEEKIHIIPNCIPDEYYGCGDSQRFRDKWNIKNKIVGFLGGHEHIKNVNELITAVSHIKEDFTLVLGGEGSMTQNYLDLILSLGIKQEVIYPGAMYDSPQDKFDFLKACDVFVLSSLKEGLGTVVLEAMSQGTPVICANAGGLPDVVPDSYCLYNLVDTFTLAKKITEVLSDTKLAKRLDDLGRQKAEQYRYSIVSKKYIELVNSLVTV